MDAVLRTRVQDAVAENDYDGVILCCERSARRAFGLASPAARLVHVAWAMYPRSTPSGPTISTRPTSPEQEHEHLRVMGRFITVVGILLQHRAAYFASMWTNAMDIIQLVSAS